MSQRTLLALAAACLLCQAVRPALGRFSVSTALPNSTAPHIRIAYIDHQHRFFTTLMKYTVSQLRPAGNRTLLPDYDITIDAFPIQPDQGMSPVAVVNVLDANTPTYHAIAGPSSRGDSMDMVDVVAAARILHVHKGSSAALSNRERYPYTFRAVRPIQGILAIWFHIASMNQWRMAATYWTEPDQLDVSIALSASTAITNYATLVERDEAAWAVEAWQAGLIDLIRSKLLRLLMVYVRDDIGWQLACRLHHAQLSGLQWFVSPYWRNGWWTKEEYYDNSHFSLSGSCTVDEIYNVIRGFLVVIHTAGSPGLNFMNAIQVPAVGGDYSREPLACMPHLTAHDWYNNGDQFRMLLEDQGHQAVMSPGALAFHFAEAGSDQDQICAILLAIHDVIYNKGLSHERIETRDIDVFEELVRSTAAVDFISPTGPFRYVNNTGDLEYIFHTFTQYASPGIDNESAVITGYVTWPSGCSGVPSIQEIVPLHWRDGSIGLGPNQAGVYPNCTQENAELKWERCEPCQAGFLYDPELKRCRPCPPGQYQSKSGAATCIPTSPGFYARHDKSKEATPCPVGHECPQAGMTEPLPCARGRYASMAAEASCKLCPVGRYRGDGEEEIQLGRNCSSCEPVLQGSITANLASESPQECICPAGRYRPAFEDQCVDCLEGMDCPQGSDMENLNDQDRGKPYPRARPGYMTLMSDPLQVYRCADEKHCPGGLPGSCGQYRDSSTRACGDCMSGAYERGDECKPCGRASALPLLFAGLASVAALVLITILVNRDVHKTPASSLMIVAATGLLFTSIQSMGVISQMAIHWVEPVKSFLELTRLLSFDLRLLKITCVMGVNPVRSFAFRQTPMLCAIPLILLTLLVKKHCLAEGKRRTRIIVELSNSVGTLLSVFFISIVISAMDPFICYKHPGDSGESVRSAPSLLCFEGGNHTAMMVIGLLAMCLVPLPFLALCIYAIVIYSSSIASNSCRDFLDAFRFLFFRYTPQCYYFQLYVFLRSFLLCLVPVLLRGQASTQVLFMCTVLAWYILLVQGLRPWRCRPCTPVDAVMTTLLSITLMCGAVFVDDTPQHDVVGVLATSILLTVVATALLLICFALWEHIAPRCWYNFFICHHKAHAAAQARFLKILLQRRRRTAQVFIDSDDLQELDRLFDIVKSRVKQVIVLLTSNTLKRPWCAGEVVTALKARVRVARLETPSFIPPTDEECADPGKYVDTTDCNLSEFGIQWEDVSHALHQLLGPDIPRLILSGEVRGTCRFEHAAAACGAVLSKLHWQGGPSDVRDPPKFLADVRAGSVFIATISEDDEANAAGGILHAMISADVYRSCEEGLVMLADYQPDLQQALRVARTVSVGVVVLTAGCLQSFEHVSIICELMQAQGTSTSPGVVSVHTPGFQFPSPTQTQRLCAALPDLESAYGGMAVERLKQFFRRISIVFPTHASQQALETQAAEVLRRIQVHRQPRKLLMHCTTSEWSGWTSAMKDLPSLTCAASLTCVAADSVARGVPKQVSFDKRTDVILLSQSVDPEDYSIGDEEDDFGVLPVKRDLDMQQAEKQKEGELEDESDNEFEDEDDNIPDERLATQLDNPLRL